MTTNERETFLRAAEMFAELCGRIGDEQWPRPGLGEWDVRALVGHTLRAVTTVATYLGQPAPESVVCESAGAYFVAARSIAGADDRAVAERGHQAGRDLGAEPTTTVRQAVERTRSALTGTSDDRLVATVVGGMRLADYLPTRTFELLAHTIDLADATGLAVTPPPEVVESAVRTAASAAAGTGDGVALFRHLLGRPGGSLRPLFS